MHCQHVDGERGHIYNSSKAVAAVAAHATGIIYQAWLSERVIEHIGRLQRARVEAAVYFEAVFGDLCYGATFGAPELPDDRVALVDVERLLIVVAADLYHGSAGQHGWNEYGYHWLYRARMVLGMQDPAALCGMTVWDMDQAN